ncbi:PREDICTED: uncharacterized protein LOC108556381 isoform X2 [Nicrophorus vespilloides]|nr:PREDICTED: uncharacterized protein LOC108556381 isoform X2 [Nicrophorus vespilloides]
MARENKLKVKKFVEKRGGIFNMSWSKENTHLAIDNFVLTVNTCSALIDKQKIVKFQYFVDCWDCIEKSEKLPDVNKYLPTPTVDMVNSNISFRFEMDRQWLFRNKTFVFPNAESAKNMKNLIGMASGKVIDIEKNRLSNDELLSSENEYLLVMMDVNADSDDRSYFGDCVRYVMRNDRRPIPLQEIPTAILDGSCDVNCNPKFNKIGHLVSAKKVNIRGQILVPETQTQSVAAVVTTLPGLSVHRKRVPPEMELPIAKRPCIPTSDSINMTNRRTTTKDQEQDSPPPPSSKRKMHDDDDDGDDDAATISAKRTNVVVQVLADLTLKSSSTAIVPDEQDAQIIEDSDDESENSVNTTTTITTTTTTMTTVGTTTMIKQIFVSKESPAVQKASVEEEPFREVNSCTSFQNSPWIRKRIIEKDTSSVEADANISFKMIVCKELTFSRSQYASMSLLNSTVNSGTALTNSSTNGERKNFKKFKKVQAHHPQTRIVSHKNLKPVKCGGDENKSSSKPKEESARASNAKDDEEEIITSVSHVAPSSMKKKKQSAASRYDDDDDHHIASSSQMKKKSKPQEIETKKRGFIFNFK